MNGLGVRHRDRAVSPSLRLRATSATVLTLQSIYLVE